MDVVLADKGKAMALVATNVIDCISHGNLDKASAQLDTIREDCSLLTEHAENLGKRIEKVIEHYQAQDDELKQQIDSHGRDEERLRSSQRDAQSRLDSQRYRLSECQSSLSQANCDLDSAERKRRDKEKALKTGAIIAGVGFTVLTLGLGAAGAVAGGAAAAAAIIALKEEENKARRARNRRQDDVRSAESNVSRTSNEISSIQSQIGSLRSQIESKQRQRDQCHKEIDKVRGTFIHFKEALTYFRLFRSAANHEKERTVLFQQIMERISHYDNQQAMLQGEGCSRVVSSFQDACKVVANMAAEEKNLQVNFVCYRCIGNFKAFPHVLGDRVVCENCSKMVKCCLGFEQPIERDDFERLVKGQAVSLEEVGFVEDEGEGEGHSAGTILGYVRVDNRAFSKHVFVRVTSDGWGSFIDVSAKYKSSNMGSNTDTFEFAFKLEEKAEFAICYEVDGSTFWDNNSGENYTITSTRK